MSRLNVLLITSEDNGPHLGCYGDQTIPTPNLDHLAEQGAYFAKAFVTQAVCSPSRASILTGFYPHQNGQFGLATHQYTMHRSFPTLPSVLKDAGYRTGRLGKLHVLPESSCPFDFVWNEPQSISFSHRDVRRTAQVAAEFIQADEDPFFLMVNYADAHLPWLPQACGIPQNPLGADDVSVPPGVGVDSPRLRAHAADYYNCLSRLDTGIGMLLEALDRSGKADETLVVFITDHGPQFSRGKGAVYELAVQVPCIVRWPGKKPQGLVPDSMVSCIDVMPTILDALDIEPSEPLPGRSLQPLLEGNTNDWRQYIFCQWTTSHPFPAPSFLYPQRSVRDWRYKLILTLSCPTLSATARPQDNPVEAYYTQQVLIDTGATQAEIDQAPAPVQRAYKAWRHPKQVELYDLETDPHEYNDLSQDAAYTQIKDRLLQVLQAWQEETDDPLRDPEKLARLLAEDRAVQQTQGGHKEPGFCWQYVDYLYD
jgi:N-sulfoglucosamine sulfohydrolase